MRPDPTSKGVKLIKAFFMRMNELPQTKLNKMSKNQAIVEFDKLLITSIFYIDTIRCFIW